MTEKNADVEWLREQLDSSTEWVCGERRLFARLLVNIDQLMAEVSKQKALANRESRMVENLGDEVARVKGDRRPTVHETAVQIMAAMRLASYLSHKQVPTDSETIASWSYADAEALVAEGRRRDGLS